MKLNSKIISIISFGILLLLLGIVLRFTSFKSQSQILMKIGFIFELYALVLYLINYFKNAK